MKRPGRALGELDVSLSRVSPPPSLACPHGLIDARTAPLTTPSSRRRVSILRGEGPHYAHTPGTRRTGRTMTIRERAMSTVARAPSLRETIHPRIEREGEVEHDPRPIRSIDIYDITRDRRKGGRERRSRRDVTRTAGGRPSRFECRLVACCVRRFTNYTYISQAPLLASVVCAKRKQIRTGEKKRM